MNVSLRQLKVFLGVAESGNFTKTAQRLHMSQAALSATVRELESQFGNRLFDRTTRNVVLSEGGRELLPTIQRIVDELESASLRMREFGRKEVSEIRLGFAPLVAAHVLPEVLDRFKILSPSVTVRITDTSPTEIFRQVGSGALDAGFTASLSSASGLSLQPILHWSLLVATSLSEAGLRNPCAWSELAEHRLIAVHDENPVQKLVDGHLKREGVQPLDRWNVNQLETSIALVERGFGVAVIPSLAASACRRYAVKLRPIGDAVADRYPFSQISRAGRALPAPIATFAEVLALVIEEASATLLLDAHEHALQAGVTR